MSNPKIPYAVLGKNKNFLGWVFADNDHQAAGHLALGVAYANIYGERVYYLASSAKSPEDLIEV